MTRYDEYDEVKRRNPGPMAAVEAEYDRAFQRKPLTLRPLRDFVVIRPLKDVQQGLIEVVRPRDKWRRGEVLAVGPGKRGKDGVRRAWGTEVGDVVQFADVLTYPEFDTGTERVLLIQEADICGVEEGHTMRQVLEDAGAA